MQKPLEITFRDTEKSAAVAAYIRTRFQKLEKFSDRIIHCHVTVERNQKHQQNPVIHNVKIQLSIPGHTLCSDHNSCENLYKGIQNAFMRIQRQLHNTTHIIEGFTKHHEDTLQGTVTKLFLDRGYGFIESNNGEKYYFSTNNLLGKRKPQQFNQLSIGAAVEFTENLGNDGLQANRVKMKRKR